MEFVTLTRENIDNEHICCAIANNNDIQVRSKKEWLSDRISEGLVFLKADVRGKCFIEYIPAEYAWAPVEAENYMYINCLWVSGQFKGHGYSSLLLDECIRDSKEKGKAGLVVLSSKKKAGFLADPKYFRYKKFNLADTADPYFELLFLPFEKNVKKPTFRKTIKDHSVLAGQKGFCITYTNQCPFTAKYIPILQATAKKNDVNLTVNHIVTREQAQNAPSPFTTFSLFYNGAFITHEILSANKFEKIIEEQGV